MDELELIRSFRADMPVPSAGAVGRAGRAWRRPEPPRRWAPRIAVAAGLAAAAIAAVVALPGGDDGRLGAANAKAAETLRRAASTQHEVLPRPLRPGEFWYLRTRTASIIGGDEGGGYTAIQPQMREEWVAADGSRHTIVRPAGQLRFPGPRDRARWEAAGRPQLTGPGPEEHHFRPQ